MKTNRAENIVPNQGDTTTPTPLTGETARTEISHDGARQRAKAAKAQVQRDHGNPESESDKMVPKASHDAR